MEITKTQVAGCTCGACNPGTDDYGNVDYGMEWDDSRSDYIARNCPIARRAAELSKSVRDLVLDGHERLA